MKADLLLPGNHPRIRNGQPAPGLEHLPAIPLNESSRRERLQSETYLFGLTMSGHPLGLVVKQRTHHQVTGEPMKFLSLADWIGIVQTELFASTYRSYGLATIRYPVLEVEARVEPFENGRGFSLRVLRAGEPRKKA